MFQVRFNEISSYDDLGLIYNTKTISEPEPQIKTINVPGRNGAIDLSEVVTGDIRYNNRKISITFTVPELFPNWERKRSELAQMLHGQRMRINFDDDLAFYWIGRVEVGNFRKVGANVEVEITADVEPYKYSITTSAEDWLWDPFDFDYGVINETADLVVNGTRQVSLIATGRIKNPIVISNTNMTVTFKGKTYPVISGSHVMYEILLDEGENILTFNGNGTVTVNYLGGML